MKKNDSKNGTNLSPIFKWGGGKRKEIKNFESYFPDFVKNKKEFTFIEPFVGGGAVYFYLNNISGINIINDFDSVVCNFYKEFANQDSKFIDYLDKINDVTDHDELEKEYYIQRNKDKNNGLHKLSSIENAIRFFIVNQLAFSGMRRFNSSGEFNVPFGHYKGINTSVIHSEDHRKLLQRTEIVNGDFEEVINKNDKKNTFIFLDPPYTRVFKEYSSGNCFGEDDHIRLCNCFKSIKKALIMMIIDKSDFTEKLYSKYIKSSYPLKYGVNIKNRFDTGVEHLIVCNY